MLSLYHGKVKVGFWLSVAQWSMGRCLISTKVNLRHSQTTNRSITDHFSINQNHQGPSQRRLTDILKIQDLADFHSVVGGSEVNCQLLFRSTRLKPSAFIWMDSVEPKEQRPHLKNERTKIRARRRSYHYFREKSKWAIGWSVGRGSIINFLAGPRDLNPRILYGWTALSQKNNVPA